MGNVHRGRGAPLVRVRYGQAVVLVPVGVDAEVGRTGSGTGAGRGCDERGEERECEEHG